MTKTLAIALIMLLSAVPSRLLAKGPTTKIVTEGSDLFKPDEISDPKILANFAVWTGPGTFSSGPGFSANAPSFIIDWSQGSIAELPKGLQKYQVSFYSAVSFREASTQPEPFDDATRNVSEVQI